MTSIVHTLMVNGDNVYNKNKVSMQKENLNDLNGLFFDLGVKCDPSFDQLCEIHPNNSDSH